MPNRDYINQWVGEIHGNYKNYLQTLFFFKDPDLRQSFQYALENEERGGRHLLKGPFPEPARNFQQGLNARELARECFSQESEILFPALLEETQKLYAHQEQAIRNVHIDQRNVVVATGTGSGKTESFLYPILFELYRQHLEGKLEEPGVRAMILYPMNALANDQRIRLGKICRGLRDQGSGFMPTFGQYIGQTPENERDDRRSAQRWKDERLPGELVFRKEMRANPPHILLTNYSMLEYLLIRPDDSPLFDNGLGKHWQFIVLDEAHQYKGTKGMEMGMLIRRLKQRLREGGRKGQFQCIATSATMSSSEERDEKKTVAKFAKAIFDEDFSPEDVIFGKYDKQSNRESQPSRYHVFVRALEGAFLVHKSGKDQVVLNRKTDEETDSHTSFSTPLEIALCRECGQHYYVGREVRNSLQEAIRDPSLEGFGVEYYLPLKTDTSEATHLLCRRCGALSSSDLSCDCDRQAQIPVKECAPRKDHPDQLKECEICGYRPGGLSDPVQEIVHGSDGPNVVIATALHKLLWDPVLGARVLAFADNRQGAAFFAWYVEDSYEDIRDRNLILRAMKSTNIPPEGLSITDLSERLLAKREQANLFKRKQTYEERKQTALKAIFREALTDKIRLSLEGVGLIQWFVEVPDCITNNAELFKIMEAPPWNLTKDEANDLLRYLINEFRRQRAVDLSESNLFWGEVSPWAQRSLTKDPPGGRKYVTQWGGVQSTIVGHFLRRLHNGSEVNIERSCADLMKKVLDALLSDRSDDRILCRAPGTGNGYRLDSGWLRVRRVTDSKHWQCSTCKSLSTYNIKSICPRNHCPGNLTHVDSQALGGNHYRILYEEPNLPPILHSEEHTAQIESNEARERQERFKDGKIHLLSSSTTFELGVDLGELEVVFLRNVPPEPFNYTQRAGRAGRRETPGLVLTYCRRNTHDLYHYENPEKRLIKGLINAPKLQITNTKIILRHIVATALSAFFRGNCERFKNVEEFIGDWENPSVISDVKRFCENNNNLRNSLLNIVPKNIHEAVGLNGTDWIEEMTGEDSRFLYAVEEVSYDYLQMKQAIEELIAERSSRWTQKVGQLEKYMRTIASENALGFLSRKAIIPKYGFPVDVVELEVPQENKKITLQRDLSQAIAEYAAGSTVVANKLEWRSYGVKVIPKKECPVKYYDYDEARNFKQYPPTEEHRGKRRYLSPIFGFVTSSFEKPKEPRGRTRRLYTTRPFFLGFEGDVEPQTKTFSSVQVTPAQPGRLVILCEGKKKEGFYICKSCGAHFTRPEAKHDPPRGFKHCNGTLRPLSLGYELETDVMRIQFPSPTDEWGAYSVAYAVLLGAAETLDVPDTDLNVTITGGTTSDHVRIVLYDNVPGGAGLVTSLWDNKVFTDLLNNARNRVIGGCRCDISCYGCLRSYRNQFAHPHLDRKRALELLTNLQ